MKRDISALFAVLLLTNLASAAYITGDIFVNEIGQARFDIESDIALDIEGLSLNENKITGRTDSLTNKAGNTWTFSLALDEYDDILLDIHLPKNLQSVLSISGPDSILDIDNKIITIVDSGGLDFQVSYKIKETTDYSFIIWLGIILIIVVAFFIYYKFKKKKLPILCFLHNYPPIEYFS